MLALWLQSLATAKLRTSILEPLTAYRSRTVQIIKDLFTNFPYAAKYKRILKSLERAGAEEGRLVDPRSLEHVIYSRILLELKQRGRSPLSPDCVPSTSIPQSGYGLIETVDDSVVKYLQQLQAQYAALGFQRKKLTEKSHQPTPRKPPAAEKAIVAPPSFMLRSKTVTPKTPVVTSALQTPSAGRAPD